MTLQAPYRAIKRIDQSPMNSQIWICELACGHEVTLTSKSRPRLNSIMVAKADSPDGGFAKGERITSRRALPCGKCSEAKR